MPAASAVISPHRCAIKTNPLDDRFINTPYPQTTASKAAVFIAGYS
jgi:hypothetical protein